MKFLLVAQIRSGSQLLRSVLPIKQSFSYYKISRSGKPQTDFRKIQHHHQWSRLVKSRRSHWTFMHYPIETDWIERFATISPKIFWQTLGAPYPKIILLIRNNKLKQFVSLEVSNQLLNYSTQQKRQQEPNAITVDVDQFVHYLEIQQNLHEKLLEVYKNKVTVLVYESIIVNWNKTIVWLHNFLDLSQITLKEIHYQQEHRPMKKAIKNFEEVQTYLESINRTEWLD